VVLTVQNGDIASCTAVVLGELNTNTGITEGCASNAASMWSYTPDGFIESQLTPGLVLSLGPVTQG
jgi:hypothetical protein